MKPSTCSTPSSCSALIVWKPFQNDWHRDGIRSFNSVGGAGRRLQRATNRGCFSVCPPCKCQHTAVALASCVTFKRSVGGRGGLGSKKRVIKASKSDKPFPSRKTALYGFAFR